jgi:soluble lytic murein transglycosylase-like protein
MESANHLTVRDYFDRVFSGKQRPAKAFYSAPGRANASGTGVFYRMLASRQLQGFGNAKVKFSGLTIVDYLANPLVAKGRYQPSPELLSAEKKADRSSDRQFLATTKSSSGKATRSLRPSVAMPAEKLSDSHERQKIEKSIQKAASKYDLSPRLIKGVIRAESNFQVDAVSRAGAQGLMQLMPATAKELGVTKPFDIDQNIDGGARYLRKMLDSFGGNVKLALAAYNAGPGTVRKFEGNVPYQETIQYVSKVLCFSAQTV